MTPEHTTTSDERSDIVQMLDTRRSFLRRTVQGLTDEQARQRTTVSALCLGGIIKHVTAVETGWTEFIVRGPKAIGSFDESSAQRHAAGFVMGEDETLARFLDTYDAVARHTDDLVASLPSLDASHPLPEAPWYEPGAHWSARTVLLHIMGETAQHAGHADIIRESLDGQKTMG
jgi:uncharacterized damage-inducible protein DinB